MSLVAAVKLVNLFELFSSPKFLYSGENAHRHLALLLEVFNNVIQYQYNNVISYVYSQIMFVICVSPHILILQRTACRFLF